MLYSPCKAQTRTFEVDPESSVVLFSVTHLGFLTVEGTFSKFKGSCIVRNDSLISVEGSIQVSSIDTGDQTRDKSLKSEAYLDNDSYPAIRFVSEEIKYVSDSLILIGRLKIRDQDRIIQLPIEFKLTEDRQRCTLEAEVSISRADFHLDFGAMDALVGDNVRVVLGIEANFLD